MTTSFDSPVVILTYGLPGAGKSAFARQFAAARSLAHVHSDRIRHELFDDASFSASENQTVLRLALYMTEELLKVGQSLVFDMHLPSQKLREDLKRLASGYNAQYLLVWIQTDRETAHYRASHRDRRRPDDKYAFNLSSAQFDQLAQGVTGSFKHTEKPAVISGKHLFKLQAATVDRRLASLGVLDGKAMAKLSPGRVDYGRRLQTRTINI